MNPPPRLKYHDPRHLIVHVRYTFLAVVATPVMMIPYNQYIYLSAFPFLPQLLQDSAKYVAIINNQVASLERARKNYEKAFKEAERALDNFQRADADLNLSRAEVEKQRMNMAIKNQHCEESKNEYANQLQKTNELQVL